MRLVLASESPRRLAILHMLGLEPRVHVTGISERAAAPGESGDAYAVDVARAKLRAVPAGAGDEVVLAADTAVVLEGTVLGKPESRADARAMLGRLAGRDHEVVTAVAVRRGMRERWGFERTRVRFRAVSPETLEAYVATGQPLDKAGAYGIQDRGAALVDRVEGCFYNVMGLPVGRTLDLLQELGVTYDAAAGALVAGARSEGEDRRR